MKKSSVLNVFKKIGKAIFWIFTFLVILLTKYEVIKGFRKMIFWFGITTLFIFPAAVTFFIIIFLATWAWSIILICMENQIAKLHEYMGMPN